MSVRSILAINTLTVSIGTGIRSRQPHHHLVATNSRPLAMKGQHNPCMYRSDVCHNGYNSCATDGSTGTAGISKRYQHPGNVPMIAININDTRVWDPLRGMANYMRSARRKRKYSTTTVLQFPTCSIDVPSLMVSAFTMRSPIRCPPYGLAGPSSGNVPGLKSRMRASNAENAANRRRSGSPGAGSYKRSAWDQHNNSLSMFRTIFLPHRGQSLHRWQGHLFGRRGVMLLYTVHNFSVPRPFCSGVEKKSSGPLTTATIDFTPGGDHKSGRFCAVPGVN